MKLSIIIPCYNEQMTIQACLDKVLSVDLGAIEKEIVVVDDGSVDGTRQALSGFKNDLVTLIFHSQNQGKGAAIKTALKNITGEIVIIQDADLEYDPQDYLKLLEVIISGAAQVVYGSRNLNKTNQKSYTSFALGGRFLSFLTNLLYGSNITDEPTAYKMFKTEILKKIDFHSKGFEFCPEVTAKILKSKIGIAEVPIAYTPRHLYDGKKITWRDGAIAIWTLIKYRFVD